MWIYYLRLACLSTIKTPVLSALMILAIAIGIATCLATLTMYSVISGNPLAHKNSSLYAVQLDSWDKNEEYFDANAVPLQLTYRDAMALYESGIPEKIVLMRKSGLTVQKSDLTGDASAEKTRMTTRDFFSMFDVEFVAGGPWDQNADIEGANVVVINETLNSRIFNGRDSIGQPLLLEGDVFTVVGIVDDDWSMVPKVYDLNNGAFDTSAVLYVPFSKVAAKPYPAWGNTQGWSNAPINSYQDFLMSEQIWIQVWVELVSGEQKQAFSRFIEAYIAQQKQYDRFQRPSKYLLSSPEEWLKINKVVSDDDRVLVGLSLAFLGVCLVNTIVLLLAKFLRKAPEAGIRRALGASQWAVFGQHLFEAMTIGVLGGLLGLVLSWIGLAGIRELYGNYNQVATVSLFTLVMALVLALSASLISGALPARRISHTQPANYLKTQ